MRALPRARPRAMMAAARSALIVSGRRGWTPAFIGVRTNPGQITETTMPFRARGWRRPSPKQAHRRLAAAVGGRIGRTVKTGEGAHQGKMAGAPAHHGRLRRLDGIEHTVKIDREDRSGALRTVWQVSAGRPGIGDHQIKRRVLIDAADPVGHRRSVGHVDRSRGDVGACLPASGGGDGESARIAAAERQMDTWSRIASCQRRADPAAGAGDQDRARRWWARTSHGPVTDWQTSSRQLNAGQSAARGRCTRRGDEQ